MEVAIRVDSRESIDAVVRLVERLGGRVIKVMRYARTILADVPASAINVIASDPHVVAIEKNVEMRPMIYEFFRAGWF